MYPMLLIICVIVGDEPATCYPVEERLQPEHCMMLSDTTMDEPWSIRYDGKVMVTCVDQPE